MDTRATITDVERDRETCIALDKKATGSNRELAQWLLDHPRYSTRTVAAWLGCGITRIKELRFWAQNGFEGTPSKRSERADSRRAGQEALKSQENFERADSRRAGQQVLEEETEQEPQQDNGAFMLAVVDTAAKAATIAKRNLHHPLTVEERLAVVRAIDKMLKQWDAFKHKLNQEE